MMAVDLDIYLLPYGGAGAEASEAALYCSDRRRRRETGGTYVEASGLSHPQCSIQGLASCWSSKGFHHLVTGRLLQVCHQFRQHLQQRLLL